MADDKQEVNQETPLPALDFKEEIELYEAKEEKTEINFPKCSHKETTIIDGWLKCKCGAGWTGPASMLVELKRELDK